MRIIYRNLQTAFLALTAILATLPLSAQLTAQQREELREKEKETRSARHTGPQQLLPVRKDIMPLPAPKIVDFTERANWDLAHPKTDFTKHSAEPDDDYKFQPKPIRSDAKISPIPGSRPNGNGAGNNEKTANSPAPLLSFNGVMGDGSEIPPDINAACGINYVMETTNQSYGIFNKSNGTLAQTVDITTFYNSSGGNGYFDPHILYDAPHGRWLAVIDGNTSGGNGGLFLGVSKTSDPTGAWYVYTIDDGVNQNTLLDFPEMGYNENWVVLTANLFSGNPTTEIYVMNRASLYNGTQGTITHFSDANSFCLSAAQTMDTTTLTEWLVQNSNGNSGGSGYVQIGSITGAVGSPTYNAGSQLGVAQPWNESAVQAPQNGGGANLIDNDDTRIYESEFINGSLWFAHTVWLPATGTATSSGVDWWQVNPTTLTVQQFGRLSAANTWYYYPNIYANSAGDALIGYSVSSTSLYASAVYSFHAATDAVNTMENIYTYKAGIASFAPSGFGGDYRWGDYTGVAIDPNDGSFWVSGEWANSGNLWSTQIAHIGASAPISLPPVANFQANVTTSCTGAIQFTDLSTNNPTSWLWTFGDGNTSTLQNPAHTYLTNGTYTVTLKATNAYGNNTKSMTGYITISEPVGPATVGASHCGSGTFSLSATTTNPVKWFDSTGTLLSTSNPYITPSLTHTTTYYVQDSVISPPDSAGPLTNAAVSASGGYLNTAYGLIFDVLQAGTLKSVYLYASAAGSVTINVTNSGGTVVNTATVNVPAGGSRVALNFPLVVGTGYVINYTTAGTVTLYRNNAGAVFPYADANNIVSITNNNAAAAGYYYWFYDWYVTGPGCNSQSSPVTATVTAGVTTGTPAVTNVACNGGTSGSATITPTGGTPSYTYNWSNGQTTATLTGVASGSYTVTVHDAASCSGTASATISQPTALNVSVTPTNISCGSGTGSITASVSGGTSGYGYLWSNAATTATASGLAAATYTLTVTDAHTCTATATATISNTGQLNITATPSAGNCSGGSTGGATTTINGGSTPFTYIWSTGATTSSITGVIAGTYHVTATDHSGCSGSATVVVTTGNALNLTVASTNVRCFNATNGTATVNVTTGTAPYVYAWNNGSTTNSITGLVAGNYIVTTTDAHSCVVVDTVTINQPSAVTIFVSAIQPTCAGLNNGSASVTSTGGTPAYAYVWSTSSTGTGISNLAAGNYSISLTDANNCTSSATFNITDPAAVTASIVTNNDSCYGNQDGSAQVSAGGGNGPYSYLWSNAATVATITGLSAGNYTVTVTDSHNCTSTTSASVTEPSQITVTTTTTDATNGQSNGSASITGATGGNPPYVVTWSNGLNGNTINNLAAGNYTATVTDHNGCVTTTSVVVSTNVGIASVNPDLAFTIYPNPAKTEITIDAGSSIDKETTMALEDVLGQTLASKNINTSTTTLDLSGLSNGVYFIELRQGGKRAVRKFVINR